ncbi:hypothetical protein CLAFUW4_09534 [Fulvia fulva]|nr:uncharacterized protein CLAFUR5_20279 [Fulvia fulva]KAK4613395.1 hypothetical protein CLAFUR4_09540 [Fulvia fulva]KAK4615026.1 hypothetical protein CLAFUR0_09531 [Fulvia fulva]WMI39013.1 hypothetical protein CLAFUR5_20279 [Fulvia fulva]WPV20296.1 hypothetical protein CLAFUW4_09534 [Fulvia fulva]WPV35712.1 hypothetical protein CLAFUW7_09535 [Fulvia fulva]
MGPGYCWNYTPSGNYARLAPLISQCGSSGQ